jgi:hypothetical protein
LWDGKAELSPPAGKAEDAAVPLVPAE